MDERAFVRNLETASYSQLAQLIMTNDVSEERILQMYFGPERYARMRGHAKNVAYRIESRVAPLGTVIILPGILGSELWEGREKIWLDIWNIIFGKFGKFPVNVDGTSVEDISAPNLLQKYYGEMQLKLAGQGWKLVLLPFDWRLDIAGSARLLKAKIDEAVDPAEPLRFVAHSMGGLVVRSLFRQNDGLSERLERFVMLGTPNFGSFAIPVLYSGLNNVLKLIAIVDQQHYMDDLLAIAKTFVGTYQMQPFLNASVDAARLFDPATYGNLNPPAYRFDGAKLFQADLILDLPLDPARCNYIAGFNESTACGILDWDRLTSFDGYSMTMSGDGTVPHSLGLLPNLTTYYVHAKHSDLPSNQQVIESVNDLLTRGNTDALPTDFAPEVRLSNIQMQLTRQREQTRLEARVADLRDKVITRRSIAPNEVSAAELELCDILATGRESVDR